MNNYQQERNNRKWLIGLVIAIFVMTIVCVCIAAKLFHDSIQQESYAKGHDLEKAFTQTFESYE